MNKAANDITAQLDAVIANAANAEAESPEAPAVDAPEGTPEADRLQVSHEGKQTPLHEIPRFKEVIAEKNAATEALEATTTKYEELQGQNSQLIEMLQTREGDTQTMNQIKSLAQTSTDGRVQSAIDTLEAAMQGKLEEVVSEAAEAAEDGTITLDAAKKMVTDAQSELQSQLTDQRVDMLWDRARTIGNEWLEKLPEEYAQEDLTAVDEMFLNRVDWDAIEADPDSMTAHMHTAFQEAIQRYGEPRGALLNAIPNTDTEEGADEVDPVVAKAADDKEVVDKLSSIDWGKLDTDGKPVISEQDFKDQMANLLKYGNRR